MKSVYRYVGLIFGLLSLSLNSVAEVLFDTAAPPVTTTTGLAITDNFWQFHRFEISSTTTLGNVGGVFINSLGVEVDVFAAIIRLSGPSDFPDSLHLTTPDLVGTTLVSIAPTLTGGEFEGTVNFELTPGWYALGFGTGAFGAPNFTGSGLIMPVHSIDLAPSQVAFTHRMSPPSAFGNNTIVKFFGTVSDPLIDPVVGNFFNIASNAGEPFASESATVQPLVDYSQSVDSGLATSQLDVDVTNNASESLIAITNLQNIKVGGNNAGLSFSIQLDVLQEATYEILGGMSVSTTGAPETFLSHQVSISLYELSPFTELYAESDGALDTTPISFAFNGVNEGNLSDPELPTRGSPTGVLAPGRYEINGTTESFSQGGGFSLTGRTDYLIRFTPTGSNEPTCASSVTGTDVDDFIFSVGNLRDLATTIVNPYSNDSVAIDGQFRENSSCYDGLDGFDVLIMGGAPDALFIENADGAQTLRNIEFIVAGASDDLIILSSDRYVLNDIRVEGANGNDIVWTNEGADIVNGGPGNDSINAGPGNDRLEGGNALRTGGSDNDTLRGWTGDDTYFYADDGPGGNDTIREGGGGLDTLEFGEGVLPSQVFLTTVADDLIVTRTDSSTTIIRIENQYGADGLDTVERILFADGTTIDITSRNQSPTAEAGTNQSVHVGDLVVLDGSGSSDDQTPSETLDYFWSFDAIPFGSSVEIVGNGTSAPTFVADVPGDYLVRLVVFDEGNRASQPDFVLISSLNVPPTADAGMDQGAIVGSQVTLDGSGSSDADGDALEFSWSFAEIPLGSAAVLIDADTSSPSFVPDLPGAYIAELVVSDGRAENGPDSVTISAVTAEQFAELNAIHALNSAGSLPPTSVTTKGNQTALTQHLTQVIKALQSDDLDAATFKLNQAIVRTDGCALRGSPDTGTGPGPHPEKDYITDCNEQKAIYLLLTEALAALSP